jgi:hypothetical protein
MTYYILDTTVGKSPIFFNTLNEVIKHLEGSCQRLHGLSREQYMQNLADLGHSADEATGRNFIVAMSDTLNVGLVKDNRLLRCDVFAATHYANYLTEMGD